MQNLTKRFGDLLVLDNLNFEVEEGGVPVHRRSDRLRQNYFSEQSDSPVGRPTAGDILVNGIRSIPKKQNISYIFQEYSSFPWLTVEQNIRLVWR